LSAVVARCLSKNREQRFESVADLASALRAFASADGQRSADRSSRPAFGSSYRAKSDRATVTPAPMTASVGVPVSSLHPASRRSWPLAAALLMLAGVALGWATLRTDGSSDAVAAKPIVAAAPPPAVTPQVEPAAPATALATTPVASTAEPELKPERARKRSGAAATAGATAPAPPSAETAKSAAPAPPSSKAAGDAWDPDRLGGRY
jgi:hypothetical protein